MVERLKIAVADDEPDMRDYFCKILPTFGHKVVSSAENGKQLVEHCRKYRPDLIITDIRMPVMDGLEAAMEICRETPMPIVVVSAYHDEELIERAEHDHIMGYLIKPIKQADLQAAIILAFYRFAQFQQLRLEAADLRQSLEDRKRIERAKGILMKRGQIDEATAFKRLQNIASDRNQKLVEIAEMILTADEALLGE